MQDRFIKKLWHTNRKCFIEEFSILQTINSEGNYEHTYFERKPNGELERLSSCQIKEVICIGSKDKNGKLIYDGDILFEDWKNEVHSNGKYWIVKWNDKHAEFYIEMINPSKYELHPQWHLSRHDLDFKVIGNIYENPELLTKDGSNE